MIQGVTKNILEQSRVNKDLDSIENYVATHLDMRNVRLTDAGNRRKRAGYEQKWDIGIDLPVPLLIPEREGYAICGHKIFKLGVAVEDITNAKLTGYARPQWLKNKNDIVIVDGGTPIEITPTDVVDLPGEPRNFRYIAVVGAYTLGAGHTDRENAEYEFMWSAAGNYENWTTGDSGNVRIKKTGIIKNLLEVNGKLYVFKDNEIEVWYNRGGVIPFARVDGNLIPEGLLASYSVVKQGTTFYWLGEDYRFYRLKGGKAELISSPFESYIQGLNDAKDVYGFLNEKEHIIQWIVPEDGKVLVYDYRHNDWSEDNIWKHGQFERIPMASYMELDNIQYFGSYNCDGLIYKVSEDAEDDAGEPIRVFRSFSIRPSLKGRRARFNRIGFHFKRGVATSSVTAPVFSWRRRFDKADWGAWDEIDLGAEGVYDPYIERFADQLGIGRECDFEIMETDAVDFQLTHMDMTAEELGR